MISLFNSIPFGFGFASYDDMKNEVDMMFGKENIDNYIDSLTNACSELKNTCNGVANFVKDNVNNFIVKAPYRDDASSKYSVSFKEKDGKKYFICNIEYVDGFTTTSSKTEVEIPENCNVDKMKKYFNKKDSHMYFVFPRDLKIKDRVENVKNATKKTLEDVKDTLKDNIEGISDAMIDKIAEKVFQRMEKTTIDAKVGKLEPHCCDNVNDDIVCRSACCSDKKAQSIKRMPDSNRFSKNREYISKDRENRREF